MINQNYFIVFDLETDGTNVNKDSPIQFAALAVHPRTLEIVPDSEFTTYSRPDDFEDEDYYENHKSTIDWHAEKFGITPEEFLKFLGEAPSEQEAWKNFIAYTKRWYIPGKAKTRFNAPILAGYNIFEFDKVFLDRLAKKYRTVDSNGEPNFYQKRDTIDIMKLVFVWSESLTALPNYKMDTLREVFGINHEGVAHEGLKDCYDEAALLIKYIGLHRKFVKRVAGWK